MLLLTVTTDLFEIVTSAAATLDVHASFVDLSGATVTPGRQNTAITTAATTTVVAAPAASTVRNLKALTARNKHATLATDVTLRFNQNGTSYEIYKVTLKAGETLEYAEDYGFYVSQGPSAPNRTYTTADQAITTADTFITGSQLLLPAGRSLAVGTILQWKFAITKSAGTGTPAWSVRFGSGVIGDTARLTFTHGVAQTGVADNAVVEIRAIVRSIGGAGVVSGSFNLDHNLAATGFATTAHVTLAVTSAGFDTAAVTGMGVSVAAGTASAWTFTMVSAEVHNLF
jgi:hypothetical protein